MSPNNEETYSIKDLNQYSINENIIKIYSIIYDPDKVQKEKSIKITFINNTKNKVYELEIVLDKDIKEYYYYHIQNKCEEIISLNLEEQFEIYANHLDNEENNEKKRNDFILSTLLFIKNHKVSFPFYILFVLKYIKSENIKNLLKLFNIEQFEENPDFIFEKSIFNDINNLSKDPSKILKNNIDDEIKKIFYKIVLLFNFNYQPDKLEELLNNDNYIYYNDFISYLPKFKTKNILFNKDNILKLLKESNNMENVLNILFFTKKEIISFLEIINEAHNKIHKLYLMEKNKKIKLIEYINEYGSGDCQTLFNEIDKLNNNKSLDYIEFFENIIGKYIDINHNNIDNLIILKKIINILQKQISFSFDINIIIHQLILEKGNIKDFIKDEIYFSYKYIKNRDLNILDKFNFKDIIDLNNIIKENQDNTTLVEIFSSNIDLFKNKIISKIQTFKEFIDFYNFLENKNKEPVDSIINQFINILNNIKKNENLNQDYIIDIVELIKFYISNNEEKLERQLINKLEQEYKDIYKEIVSKLFDSNEIKYINKATSYLNKDPLFLIEIINLKKDIIIKNKKEIKIEGSFKYNENLNKLYIELEAIKKNGLLPYIKFSANNFKNISIDDKLLFYIIENLNNDEWILIIKENIQKFINSGKLKNLELLKMINLIELEKRKNYVTLDIFKGIDAESLIDEICFNEFKNSKLIEILYKKNDEYSNKIESLLSINTKDEIHPIIKYIFEEIKQNNKVKNNLNKNIISNEFNIYSYIIEIYINININNIDKLIKLKNSIIIFSDKIKLSEDINIIIHKQIIKLNIINNDYFIEDSIYFNDKYKSYRKIDIFNNYTFNELIKLNNFLKNNKKTTLLNIFELNKDELIKLIISKITDFNEFQNFYEILNNKSEEAIDSIIEQFIKILNQKPKPEFDFIIDIVDLIKFYIENNNNSDIKIMNKLYENYIAIYIEVIKKLIDSKIYYIINKAINYLKKDPFLLIKIINNKRDIIKAIALKIIVEGSFELKKNQNLDILLDQLELIKKNGLLPYIKILPNNFNNINIEPNILVFIIKNFKEDEWIEFIKKNIQELVNLGKLNNFELLEIINKIELENRKKYLSLEIFKGIDFKLLNDKTFFNEFKKSKLIEILYKKNNNEYKSIIKLILSIDKKDEIHPIVQYIFDEIKRQHNENNNKWELFKYLYNNDSKYIEIYKEIIQIYIDRNLNNIDKLIKLKNLIINPEYKIKLSIDINKIIHEQQEQRIKQNEKNYDYFINDDIYFDKNYEQLRNIDILNNFSFSELLELNKQLKEKNKDTLEKIFYSKKQELFKLIIRKIKDFKDFIDFNNFTEDKNDESSDFIIEHFIKIFENIKNQNKDYIVDIAKLMQFYLDKNNELGIKILELLYKEEQDIHEKIVLELMKSNNNNLIQKTINYLQKDSFLLIKIINKTKDILIKFLNEEQRTIKIINPFNFKENQDLDKLYEQLEKMEQNKMLHYIRFSPGNFEKIDLDTKTLNFIIKYLRNKEWIHFIKENIQILINKEQLNNLELFKMINLIELYTRKDYITLDIFKGINIESLKERNIFNEFEKAKLIEIFYNNNYKEYIDSIIILIKDNKDNIVPQNIKYILDEIIEKDNESNDIKHISEFIYLILKKVPNQSIQEHVLNEIKDKYKDKILDIILLLEKYKDLSDYCLNSLVKYFINNNNNNINNIIELLEKSEKKDIIFSNLTPDYIININQLENLSKELEKDNYKLLSSAKIFFDEKTENIDYVKESKEIMKKLMNELKNINIFNYNKIEKYVNDQNILDFLYIDKEEKEKDIKELKEKIQKYKSTIINVIIVLLLAVIISFIFPILFNNSSKYNLEPINWNISNISKEYAKSEYYKYPFEFEQFLDINGITDNKIENNELVIGINFGIINTEYSYSIKPYENSKIYNEKIFPSEVEINNKGKQDNKYSYKASVSLLNYRNDELKKINFIKGIKSLLYMDKFNDDNLCFVYPSEYISNCNIKDVIKEYFEMIKNDILLKFKQYKNNYNKIKWVFTLPESWNEFYKQIILNAAIESGITNLNLIYENEATSLSIFTEKSFSNNIFKRKNSIILIDMGGIDSQVTINEINKEIINEKIYIKNNIEKTGFLIIVKKIINVFEKIFGINNIYSIKRQNPGNWIKLLKDIYKAIENSNRLNGKEIFEINIPFSDSGEYEYNYESDKGNKKNYIIKFSKYTLFFPGALIGDFIMESVNKITNNLDSILKELKSKKIGINNIFISGGLSKNKIIREQMKKKYEEYFNINYFSSYENLVSNGAVLYGINSTKLFSRFIHENIGIKINNKIELLLKKGNIINNYIAKTIIIKPSSNNQKIIQLNLYTSENELINEDDFLGRLLIFLEKNDKIKVVIKYDVVLSFNAYEYNNNKVLITKFEYFKTDI